MSIQQNMASDIYRMADSVHRSRDIAAFQQSLAQSIKSGAVESYVGIPVLQSLTQKLKLFSFDVRFLGDDYINQKFTADYLPIKTIYTDRSHGYSTTDLKKKITESYMEFVK